MSAEINSTGKARPTIFLIEEDDDARPQLTKTLRKHGYRLLVAANVADAHEWMESDGYIHADAVVIDLIGKTPEDALSIGRELREHAKYNGHTPLIVMPEKFSADDEGTDEQVGKNDWLCYYADSDQLHTLLGRLLG